MINECIEHRYPGDFPRTVAIRNFFQHVCLRHIELRLADPTFAGNVCSENDARHWQGLSEALVAHEFLEVGIELLPTRDAPDLLFRHQGRDIWVEIICPEARDVPENWLRPNPGGGAVDFPHEAILLRWTSAIKEKAEKLLGNSALNIEGYLAKGMVGADDSYVIAINCRLLKGFQSGINGISQLPFAAEATFAIGPYAISINRETLEKTGEGHTLRTVIRKPNGSNVPADTFFDQKFRHISAILACDLDGGGAIGNNQPVAAIHNPNAVNPVPAGLLPAHLEYIAVEQGDGEYILERRSGRLKPEETDAVFEVEIG